MKTSTTATGLAISLVAAFALAIAGAGEQPGTPSGPFVPDEYTLVLAHFDRSIDADHAAATACGQGRGRIVLDGRFGGGLSLSGRNEVSYEAAGNAPGREGTVEFWIRPEWPGDDGQNRHIFGMAGAELNYLNINKLPTGRLGAGMAGKEPGKDFVYRRADALVTDWKARQWHHVAVCWKDDVLSLWIDGKCVREMTGALPPQSSPEKLRCLGGDHTLDELRISNVARYSTQGVVQGKPVTPHVVLHRSWKFVEPEGVYRAAKDGGGLAQAGMLVIPKSPLDETEPQDLRAAPAKPESRLFAAPGQIEPATFLVVAQGPLKALHVRPTNLSSGSNAFLADRITVRRVVRTPERKIYTARADQTLIANRFLARWQPIDVPQGELREVWLSVDVPADCAPGDYLGRVVIEHAGGSREIPLRLEVLPIRLIEHAHKQLGMYYRMHPQTYDPDRLLRELRDMRSHGVRHLVSSLSIGFHREGEQIHTDLSDLGEGLDAIRAAGFRDATVVVGSGLTSLAALTGHGGTASHKIDEAFGEDPLFDRLAKQAIADFLSMARQYPELRLVLTHLDEIFNGGRMPLYLRLARAVRQVPEAKLYITFHTRDDKADELRRQIDPWVDIRCHHGYTFEWWLARGHTIDEYEKELQAAGDEAWFYHNARGPYFTPSWARIINGLYLWAGPFRVHTPWIYQAYFENPFDDTDGPATKGHDWVLSAPGTDDPADLVPSRLWEAMREGADDLRYFATLEKAIAEAAPSKRAQTAEAQRFLDRLKNLVRRSRPRVSLSEANLPGKPLGAIDLDTGLQMGEGVVGTAEESPLIHALDERFQDGDWQQIRRQTAEWILTLQP